LAIPILSKSLGVDLYGKIAFYQSIFFLTIGFVDYSFNLTATREIASIYERREPLNRAISKYYSAKLMLLSLSITVLLGLAIANILSLKMTLVFLPMLVGAALFPIWLFQGVGQTVRIAMPHITSKCLALAAIVYCVDSPDDFYTAAAIMASVYMTSGIIAVGQLYWSQRFADVYFDLTLGLTALRESRDSFFGTFSTSIQANFGMIVLGFAGEPEALAIFATAAKVKNGLVMSLHPLNQFFYPKFAVAYEKNGSPPPYVKVLTATFLILSIVIFGVSIAFTDVIMHSLLGSDLKHSSIRIAQIVLLAGMAQGLRTASSYLFLSASGGDRLFRQLSVIHAVALAAILACCSFVFDDTLTFAIAVTYLLVELGSFATLIYFLHSRGT